MTKIDDGGPAFPFAVPVEFQFAENGMSIRDHFAGQALAGLYACRDLQLATLLDKAKTGSGQFEECMAKQAYAQADAMIAARKSEGQ